VNSTIDTSETSGTRQAILAAAKALLAEHGRDALNMSRVARAAKINRGTTYLHYASREALLLDTLKEVSRELCEEIFSPERLANANNPHRWIEGASHLARFAMTKPALGQIWLNYILTSDDAASDPFWKQWLESARQLAKSDRSHEGVDAEVLAVMFLSTYFVWPVWVDAHTPPGSSREVMARRLAAETVRLMHHGVLREAPKGDPAAARPRATSRTGARREARRAGRAISGT
jgi:AcrR family transcriptional regulator